jgi:hypothetical protein
MVATFPAPLTPRDALVSTLAARGYAVLAAADVRALAGGDPAVLQPAWDDLPLDAYLRDGGNYRRRRHSCFVVGDDTMVQAPHRAHWQSLDYNALHGGMARWFEPIAPADIERPEWGRLLRGLGACFSAVRAAQPWYVEAHQFRIDTSDGIGRPTPEGAHRDGVDFVAVFLVDRHNIKGGETRVFEASGPDGQRFMLEEPWSVLLLDDTRMIHESTPIQPAKGRGHRDTLVLTYRAGAFQGDD